MITGRGNRDERRKRNGRHETKEVGVVRRNWGKRRAAMQKRASVEIIQGGEMGGGEVRGKQMEI